MRYEKPAVDSVESVPGVMIGLIDSSGKGSPAWNAEESKGAAAPAADKET